MQIESCEKCPASGVWPWYGPGRWCFGYGYFYGKTGKPVLCSEMIERRERMEGILNVFKMDKVQMPEMPKVAQKGIID